MNWNSSLDLLKEAGEIDQYLTASLSEEEVAQYLFMNLAQAFVLTARQDPERPEFSPYSNPVFNHSATNPDNIHYFATIDGNNQYRISGYRNSVHMIEFQVGFDWQGFAKTMGRSTQTVNMKEFEITEDGYFEILLSRQRPEGFKGNWIQLEPRSNYVVVRQISYHPHETYAPMAIENLSPIKTSRRAEFNDNKMRQMIDFVKYNASGSLGFLKVLEEEGIVNKLKDFDYSDLGGVKNQVYQQGLYRIAEDQAMIVTFRVPETCGYWNIQATSRLWQTNESVYAQGSLNGHIDRADSDGLTRVVLSHKDPGISNWIDLDGNEEGYILLRWTQCNNTPVPEIKLVVFNEIDSLLPGDAQRISPAEREEIIRKKAVERQLLRRYW